MNQILFLGERDLLYYNLTDQLNDHYTIKVFDTKNLRKVHDDHISYLDLTNKQILEDFIKAVCQPNMKVNLIVSDDFQWYSNQVSHYVSQVERLFYGAIHTLETLLKLNFIEINVIILVNTHHKETSLMYKLYPSIFEHINQLEMNKSKQVLHAHLLYLVHDTAYHIDSYAKTEFGYTNQNEEMLQSLFNRKIKKVTELIMSIIDDKKNNVHSSVLYVED